MISLLSQLMLSPTFAQALDQVQTGAARDAHVIVKGTPVWIEPDEDIVIVTSNSWTFPGFEVMFEIHVGGESPCEMATLTTHDPKVADALMRRGTPGDPADFDILAAHAPGPNPTVPLRTVLGPQAATLPAVFRPMLDAPARFEGLTTGRPYQVEIGIDPLDAVALSEAA